LGLPLSKKVLLICGGSSGAVALNGIVAACLDELLSEYAVIHIVGKNSPLPEERKNYIPLAYSDDMPSLYASADAVVSRAGATALHELSALKKKALFIPLPKGVSRGDQIFNAELAVRFGGNMLLQENMSSLSFLESVRQTFAKPAMFRIAAPVNEKIVSIITARISSHRSGG
jgi:UDP-N-acetylglucosamine--N-acetylmuramyl-(pentapeptide) pyrophosphoryl-undecaprenol N-acetylglucosamine transferase